ncbi:DUF3866 family protein [Aneurinibacillus tyrosinisolvens]|uniref:DUF3866 family protein n=1 Tax=Aneurinibacillus tyrosinisolvens TaxID=1443435 RepID=UPI00063F2FBF|nr:DUF3866 family protein [Aneurinibacillus tyrosinisolvens]
MIMWSAGQVTEIVNETDRLQEIRVELPSETVKALHYPALMGKIKEGELVVLNTTAHCLSLGTGGFHYVAARFSRQGKPLMQTGTLHRGHIMKLRYTPLQLAICAAEEVNSSHHERFQTVVGNELSGVPVLVGELHSMLPAICLSAQYIYRKRGREQPPRICYIMTDSGALPMALSSHVHVLRECGLLTGTITCGHAFGGETECINIYTALLAAVHIWQADIVLVMPGPGIVGTGTPLGFSGIEQVFILQAVHQLQGIPVMVPRVSGSERRQRHLGISHHTKTIVRYAAHVPFVLNFEETLLDGGKTVPYSKCHTVIEHEPLDIELWQQITDKYPLPLTTMGRTIKEDPVFFAHAYYAAQFACAIQQHNKAAAPMDLFS